MELLGVAGSTAMRRLASVASCLRRLDPDLVEDCGVTGAGVRARALATGDALL